MDVFTGREDVKVSPGPDSEAVGSSAMFTADLRIDSRGRISIPAPLRRNYGLGTGSVVELRFSLRRGFAVLVFGRDGVADGTGSCGVPGPGSKAPTAEDGSLGSVFGGAGYPGPDPRYRKGGVENG